MQRGLPLGGPFCFFKKKSQNICKYNFLYYLCCMIVPNFNFVSGEKVIWLAPSTSSIFANFLGFEIKSDGNIWAIIQPLPSLNKNWDGDKMIVPSDQIVPAF